METIFIGAEHVKDMNSEEKRKDDDDIEAEMER
jgi:hypothetical protein